METTLQHQNRLHYAEVYVSDIFELKNLFLQRFGLDKINESFGIPFLVIKKDSKMEAFASLIIDQNNQIGFEIYEISDLKLNEKEDFKIKANNYFKRNTSEDFRNPEQLKSSIQELINGLNV
ncbi:hypothetical protein [Chryseobacterium sp. MMS23-Vi53]|uniref:hypothetical protein n=1 Tax=Chryseobacterium sp. MMS23-Vi53 TaxID=3386644 RepID=UPI0039E8F0CB